MEIIVDNMPIVYSDIKKVHKVRSMAIDTLIAHLKIIILMALGLLVLFTFSDEPYTAFLLLDILLCTYLSSLFKTKYRLFFLLHPIILLISSQLFSTSFLALGDGEAYSAVIAQYLDTQSLSFDLGGLLATYGFLGFLKYTSLGAAPIYSIPEYFFSNPSDRIYYMWQGTFHVALCALVVTLARTWRVVGDNYLFSAALFAVVSPSFFDLGAAPTRHVLTFFGVFLLFFTHLAISQRLTIIRAVWFAVAVMMILISKAPLMLPYMIFALIDQVLIKRIKFNAKAAFLLGMLAFGGMLIGDYLYQTIIVYEETSQGGAATFSKLTHLPIIGWVFKYVYAFLAPFPWLEAPLFIATNYGGNWLLFLMHTLSALIGLYFFFVVIIKWRAILTSDVLLKQMVAYGVVMSLSILKGATGFHTYLLIYFPMFAPLLNIRRFRINLLIPIGFVVFLETIVLVGK